MPLSPRVCLDSCALLRLFDIGDQVRMVEEARAIEHFLGMAQRGTILWVAGEVIEAEVLGNPDPEIRSEAMRLQTHAAARIVLTENSLKRAADLERLGYGAFDALHLASAEQAGASCLLTTDDRFLRRAQRRQGSPLVKVQNPVHWLREFRP
jgi:predicted nucleic acid-binding protein